MPPSRVAGRTKTAIGNVQARIAGFFGFHGKATQHRQKAMSGHGERMAANTSGWMSGTGNRAKGKGHGVLGALSGNRGRQAKGNAMNNMGRMRQNFNAS